MRELILKMSVSLDSFVAGPDGEIGWVFGGDQEAIAWSVETVSNASLHIMGSRVFRDMAGFWPSSTSVFAPAMNGIPKAVFSRQGPAVLRAASGGPSGALRPGAQSWAEAYVAGGELAQEIAGLKAGAGKPIVAHGGAGFARSLVAENLVDEYALLVHPIALGDGLPIFSGLAAPRRLRLVSSRAFPGGSVAQIYRPV